MADVRVGEDRRSMMAPSLCANDRLLVFAPHPDDETLAAGELIQTAHAAGASVRVVFATDGDNNPWPQRWLERRWRIGDAERARWGARRRHEAAEALSRLGLDVEGSAHFLGWPDQGLTDSLMRDDRAVDRLVEEIRGFAPTHTVLPTLADRHPDHSALRVMLELALLRSGSDCIRLGYVVHAATANATGQRGIADTERQRRKQAAMQAYVSQMSLSRRHLVALAARPEQFEVAHTSMSAPQGASTILIPHRAGARRRHELLLVTATRTEIRRWRVPLSHTHTQAIDGHGHALAIDVQAGAVAVSMPIMAEPILAVFSKVNRRGPRLLIFDHEPWHETVGTQAQAPESLTIPAGALNDA
jgi:LmbE family N-acetylglucosaminyl deacetylase